MIDHQVIEKALAKIRDYGANYVYFFQNLQSPDWLEPLWNANFFRKPPEPQREGDMISYPPWVESQYLVRMAGKSPALVAKIASQIENTTNVRVHHDILQIAINVSPEFSNLLVKKICSFLPKTHGLFIHGQIPQLIKHWADGESIEDAFAVSKAALELVPDPNKNTKKEAKNKPDEIFFSYLEPKSVWQKEEYKEILANGVQALISKRPLAALKLLSEILNHAIDLSVWDDEKTQRDWEDASISWRPAVEEHGQNNDFGYKQLIVPFIRDAAVSTLQLDPNKFPEVEAELARFKWDIFKRIYIHVSRVCANAAGLKRITSLLTNHDFFDSFRFKHEWSLLLSEQFKNLSESDRQKILSWIDTEFDANGRISSFKERYGKVPDVTLVEGWKKRWQRDHLFFMAADLPETWKERYDRFIVEIGQPEHPDFVIWSSGVMSGSTSPKSIEQIKAMRTEELIQYLADWKRSEDPMGESYEGLAGVLQVVIKSEPARFQRILEEFKRLRTAYVKAAIRGLNEAAGDGKEIDWNALLELCIWVLQQKEKNVIDGQLDEDREWKWSRMEIIRAISGSLKREKGEIPYEHRDMVWRIINILVEDPELNVKYEKKYARGRAYSSLSINATRGVAMHALFDYANWVRKCAKATDNENPAVEILGPLTTHLDIKQEPTLTIRTVYSQHFAWLYHFHKSWLQENLEKIFPQNSKLREFRNVAWETYVVYTRPWLPLFSFLNNEYERAIRNISKRTGREKDYNLQHPDEALAQHLVTLYWWGESSIDDKNSLISRFFKKAPDITRAHAIEFAGRAVWNTKEAVPKEILERLQYLFDKRLETARRSKIKANYEKEFSAFGPWVYSRKFDEKWTLNALEKSLTLTKKREGLSGYILEFLGETSLRYPLETVRCLRLMMAANEKRAGWYFESKKVKVVLLKAAKSANPEAQQIASEIQETLTSRGMFEFRNLE